MKLTPLWPAQPSDLRPVFHDQHPLPPRLNSRHGHGKLVTFQFAAPRSVFSCPCPWPVETLDPSADLRARQAGSSEWRFRC
jgi:hypothetical protein